MERIIDYLAEEESRRASEKERGTKMTEQQKRAYKLYRKECAISGVEPVLADFLAGDISSCVPYQLELEHCASVLSCVPSQAAIRSEEWYLRNEHRMVCASLRRAEAKQNIKAMAAAVGA